MSGETVIHRCSDIGKFAFSGSVRRTCSGSEFDGDAPNCLGLKMISIDSPVCASLIYIQP